MRHTLVPCLLGCALALAACGSEDDPPSGVDGGTVNPDAAAPDSGGGPDAGPADVGEADAGRAPVAFTIYDNGNALPGINVVTSDADGETLGFEATPFGGTLLADVPENGGLTALVRFPNDPVGETVLAFSYFGVMPGDELHLGARVAANNMPPLLVTTASIAVPGPRNPVGRIEIDLGCAQLSTDTATVLAVAVYDDCLDADGRFNVLVREVSDENGVLAYGSRVDVVPDRSASTPVNIEELVDATRPFVVDLTGPQPRSLFTQLETSLGRSGLFYTGASRNALLLGGTTLSVPVPTAFTERMNYQVIVAYGEGTTTEAVGAVAFQRTEVPEDMSLDLSVEALPPIFDVILRRGATDRVEVEWSRGPGGHAADGQVFSVTWTEGTTDYQWSISLPPDATGFRFPNLPTRFADYLPSPTADLSQHQLYAVELSFVDGWDELRQVYGPLIFQAQPPPDVDATQRFSLGGELPF